MVAAVVLDQAAIRRMPQLADSKLLTPAAREDAYAHIMQHAVDWHVVTIPLTEIDAPRAARVQRRGHAPRVRRADAAAPGTC